MQTLSQTNGDAHVVAEKPTNGHTTVNGNAATPASQPFGNWPNDAGFNASQEQRTPIELTVTGKIPSYAAGVLYRTGPGHHIVPGGKNGDFHVSHWFDGFTHIHRFQILPQPDGTTKVVYNSRHQVDKLLEQARKTGNLGNITFGQRRDPCDSFYKKFKTVFESSNHVEPELDNTGVTVSLDTPGFHKNGTKDELVATTDANRIKTIDPKTLEPLGCTSQTALHPLLKGPLAAAHAERDPVTGDIFNYNLSFGRTETYRVFKTAAATGQTEILATIAGPKIRGAYLHSLFLTADFVVLCIWPAFFAAKGARILWERNILRALAFDPAAQSRWLVVDRHHGRGVVAAFTSPAMFCFHTVNAWQTPAAAGDGTVDIVCELVQYENMDILHNFYYENMISTSPGVKDYRGPTAKHNIDSQLARYRLAGVPVGSGASSSTNTNPTTSSTTAAAELVFKLPIGLAGDLPTINPRLHTKPHRHVYSVVGRGKSSFVEAICKTDTASGTAIYWETPAHTPGEPVFVRNPDAAPQGAHEDGNAGDANGDAQDENEDEDDGVVLSVVLDGPKGASYLLCLDARTLAELGRAECPAAVGFGFHGLHYPAAAAAAAAAVPAAGAAPAAV